MFTAALTIAVEVFAALRKAWPDAVFYILPAYAALSLGMIANTLYRTVSGRCRVN